MMTVEEVIDKLKENANSKSLEGMSHFGIEVSQRLGVSIPNLRKLAKEIGKDHKLALELWKTGISEARILASMLGEPEKLTEKQMEDWVKDFNSWDVCDQTCLNLFEKSPIVLKKIHDWSKRDEEFVKRTAYALIACLVWHDKKMPDEDIMKFFPLIKNGADDNRNFVRKAVNWALRNIGKRNLNLNKEAIKLAKEIKGTSNNSFLSRNKYNE